MFSAKTKVGIKESIIITNNVVFIKIKSFEQKLRSKLRYFFNYVVLYSGSIC